MNQIGRFWAAGCPVFNGILQEQIYLCFGSTGKVNKINLFFQDANKIFQTARKCSLQFGFESLIHFLPLNLKQG